VIALGEKGKEGERGFVPICTRKKKKGRRERGGGGAKNPAPLSLFGN